MKEKTIQKDSEVLMHYTLRLHDDSIADSSLDHDRPVYLKMGEEHISEEFERQLLGLKVKDKKRIYLQPIDAFGEIQEQLIYALPRDKFNQLENLEVGTIVAFTFPQQGEQPGIIRQISDNIIIVDFNHPLAGQSVMYDVDIVDIDPEAKSES